MGYFRHPELSDREWLRYQYVTLGKSSVKIAKEVGVSKQTILTHLRNYGIPRRPNRNGMS